MAFPSNVNKSLPPEWGGRLPEIPQRYYTDLGRACDFVLRCKDCQRLIRTSAIQKNAQCACGNGKFAEVRTLTTWEWVKIRVGLFRFPYWREFLKEFEATRSVS